MIPVYMRNLLFFDLSETVSTFIWKNKDNIVKSLSKRCDHQRLSLGKKNIVGIRIV
jgi:hypothetical protein